MTFHVVTLAFMFISCASPSPSRPTSIDASSFSRQGQKARLAEVYASSTPLSRHYSNDKLKQMKFRFDPSHPLTEEQLQRLPNALNRAQHSHPDHVWLDRRKCKNTVSATPADPITNGQYVERTLRRESEVRKERYARDKQQRDEVYKRTGIRIKSKDARNVGERLQRARAERESDIVHFRVQGNTWRADPQRRTNAEYLQMRRDRLRRNLYSLREKRRAQAKERQREVASPSAPQQHNHADSRSEPSSPHSSVGFSDLSDIVPDYQWH